VDATPEENWLPVDGREGEYEVSDQGRVRSVDRVIQTRNGSRWKPGAAGTPGIRRLKGRTLRPGRNASGHLYVVLGGRDSRTVHALVAAAFHGPMPEGCEVRHLNGNPGDNRPDNLQYGTRSENAEDSKRHGTHFHAGVTECIRGHDLTDPANLQKTAKGDRRTCLACRRERAALYSAGSQVTVDGYCINGHPKTPENRYTNGSGGTRCKPCALARKKAG
jgi:hypothetical protein